MKTSRYQNDPIFREECKRRSREYRSKNKEKCNVTVRNWKRNNRKKCASYERKRLYGLTREKFQEMLLYQNNKCSICDISFIEGESRIHVDHCHESLVVRGLLCNNCNLMVGWWEHFDRNPKIKDRVINYLGFQNA